MVLSPLLVALPCDFSTLGVGTLRLFLRLDDEFVYVWLSIAILALQGHRSWKMMTIGHFITDYETKG